MFISFRDSCIKLKMNKLVVLLAVASLFLAPACQEKNNADSLPALTTGAVSAITATTATLSGNISDQGTPAYTERGLCCATTENPTVEDKKTTVAGTGTGDFSTKVVGLTASTLYYVRTYAISELGTVYGNEVCFLTKAGADVGGGDDNDTIPTDTTRIQNDELVYTPAKSTFQLWAPTAIDVVLSIYSDGSTGSATTAVSMQKTADGYWHYTMQGDLKGMFYTFKIFCSGQYQYLAETPGIWAKAVGVNGNRAAIIDMAETNPPGWENDTRPPLANFTDIVIYEMHHHDFSIDTNSGITNRGKFLALTETGTKSADGLSTGLDHLKELGITHVQILPSFEYAGSETQNTYNWGYSPKNYNVPEGTYATDPNTPAVRINEFKRMVQALHKNGIRVIMDVVYNHTSDTTKFCYNLTYPGYFYRYYTNGTPSNGSNCGNDVASEKPEVRNYIVESVKYWVNEYHVDGFRFDLMGVHDITTMNLVRSELDKIDPTIYILGEGWDSNGALPSSQRATIINGLKLPRIAVFSGDMRDATKGATVTAPGFVQGVAGKELTLKLSIGGATQSVQGLSKAPYANNPDEVVNYVSCHDGRCLYDFLVATAPNATEDQLMRYDLLAQTFVFTSQGVPFIQAGEELYRTRGGQYDTMGDAINKILWANKKTYSRVYDYYRNLIAMRKAHPAFRMTTAQDVAKNLTFLPASPNLQIAYTLNGAAVGDSWKSIVVAFNGSGTPAAITIPAGNWTIVCDDANIDLNGLGQVSGSSITVKPSSAFIAYQQ